MIEFITKWICLGETEVARLEERYLELRELIKQGKKSHGTYKPYQKELTLVTGQLTKLGY